MGRWTQYDEDDYRLPDGMKRIGYDADTGRYYFRDGGGHFWQSAEGSEYGELSKVDQLPSSLGGLSTTQDDDLEAPPPTYSNGYQPLNTDPNSTNARKTNTSAYRTIFPFFLLISVVLLLVWRLILSPGLSDPIERCPAETKAYLIQPGDSCWEVATKHGISLEKFQKLNPKLPCDPLIPGAAVCLPKDT